MIGVETVHGVIKQRRDCDIVSECPRAPA